MKGGGVSIFCMSSFHTNLLESSKDIESIAIIFNPNRMISCMHVTQDTMKATTCTVLCISFFKNAPTYLPYIHLIMGDCNTRDRDINWDTLSAPTHCYSDLCDILFNPVCNLCQRINAMYKGNIVELVLSDSVDNVSNITIHNHKPELKSRIMQLLF